MMKRKIDRRCKQLKKEVLGPCRCDKRKAAESTEAALMRGKEAMIGAVSVDRRKESFCFMFLFFLDFSVHSNFSLLLISFSFCFFLSLCVPVPQVVSAGGQEAAERKTADGDVGVDGENEEEEDLLEL